MSDRVLGRQWFHGSPEELKPGTELKPTAATGKKPTRGDSLPDKVYVTPHPFVAAQYTWHPDQFGTQDREPRGHVYEVEPMGRTLKDPNVPRHAPTGISYMAKGARVVRKLDRSEWQ